MHRSNGARQLKHALCPSHGLPTCRAPAFQQWRLDFSRRGNSAAPLPCAAGWTTCGQRKAMMRRKPCWVSAPACFSPDLPWLQQPEASLLQFRCASLLQPPCPCSTLYYLALVCHASQTHSAPLPLKCRWRRGRGHIWRKGARARSTHGQQGSSRREAGGEAGCACR